MTEQLSLLSAAVGDQNIFSPTFIDNLLHGSQPSTPTNSVIQSSNSTSSDTNIPSNEPKPDTLQSNSTTTIVQTRSTDTDKPSFMSNTSQAQPHMHVQPASTTSQMIVTIQNTPSSVLSTKKRKQDFYTIFSEIKQGKRPEDIEFIDIEGQPPNSVFRFTEAGISKYRDGLQKLCRENYKKLREYGVIPFDDNSQKQKVVYTRRLFQFLDPGIATGIHLELTFLSGQET